MVNKRGDIKTVLNEIAKKVDPEIEKILCSSVLKKHQRIIKYQMSSGGKRLRPALAVLCCNMTGGKTKDVLSAAALLEILHNYTLIVDDIIDHSELRRNKPTVWKKYGKSIAECISMDYAASIFDAPKFKNSEEVYQVLARALKEIADGQILDILFEQGGREDEDYLTKNRYKEVSIKDYYSMISKKTASLFRACCEIGGICAGAKSRELELLKNFGFNLGMAFQIQDDILDMFGDEKDFGKQIKKDIVERKLGNIVILLAMKEFSPEEKKKFLNILRKKKITDTDVKRGLSLIKKTKVREKAIKLEMNFTKKAEQSLAVLPQNKWNKVLQELTKFLVTRKV